MKKVGIIMGSDSDLPVVQKAIDTLKQFDVPVEVHVYSAHRTPVEARDFAMNARANGIGVIIAAAGKAAVGRTGKPEDIAHTASFLASEGAGFVTGQVIYVAGSPCD